MRHIATLIAAAAIAPLAWILLALGQDRSIRVFADAQTTGTYHGGDFGRPFLVLAAAGLLFGLIATLRISPLGAVVAGAAYASSYIMLLFAPKRVMSFRHDISIAGHHADPTTPIRTGTTLVLGMLLLVSVVSVRRWRRWPRWSDEAFRAEPERPLGLDGLDLTQERPGTGPETSARYQTRPVSAGSGSSWASLRDSGENRY